MNANQMIDRLLKIEMGSDKGDARLARDARMGLQSALNNTRTSVNVGDNSPDARERRKRERISRAMKEAEETLAALEA